MSKPTNELQVLSKDQAARVDRIKAYHAAALKAFGDQMGYAYLTGLELNVAKAEIPHGSFTKWRKEYLPELPERTSQQYMLFVDKLSKSATVADLPAVGKQLLLTNGEIPEKDREKILKAVHEVADGKTLTQLYRDLGVIKLPKRGGNPNGQVKNLAADLTADDEEDDNLAEEVRKDMLFLAAEFDTTLQECSTAMLHRFHDAHRLLGEKLAAVLKRRKAK